MMEYTINQAVELLARRAGAITAAAGQRRLIALAGPPASGKSTTAKALVARLNGGGTKAILIPMDGFHLDNRILKDRGLMDRKGAPETFDADGFVHSMRRLRNETDVILPDFDRDSDISVAGAIAVDARHTIAVVEGNYLCFSGMPWHGLQQLWHLSVYFDVPRPVLEERLMRRWLEQGLTSEAARRKTQENDLVNADRVAVERVECDLVLRIANSG